MLFTRGGHFFNCMMCWVWIRNLDLPYQQINIIQQPARSTLSQKEETEAYDFGEGMKNVYALDADTEIIRLLNHEVHMAAHTHMARAAVSISRDFHTARRIPDCLCAVCSMLLSEEENLEKWYADNIFCEVHAYPETGKYAIVNNSSKEQVTKVFDGEGNCEEVVMAPSAILWHEI